MCADRGFPLRVYVIASWDWAMLPRDQPSNAYLGSLAQACQRSSDARTSGNGCSMAVGVVATLGSRGFTSTRGGPARR
jgi:hypothetical protein